MVYINQFIILIWHSIRKELGLKTLHPVQFIQKIIQTTLRDHYSMHFSLKMNSASNGWDDEWDTTFSPCAVYTEDGFDEDVCSN